MTVKKLIQLLKKEDKNAEVMAWLSQEMGWQITGIGVDDAIVGRMKTGEKDFVLLPIEIPEKFEEWAKEESE